MNKEGDTYIEQVDAQVAALIRLENQRQEDYIELIASENYTSRAVMQAVGSQLSNKYAEGYPGKRYYGGCERVDEVEKLAISRLKEIYGAEAANVQPHSGSQANQTVFFSVLNPGDEILGMSPSEGGHFTHGMPSNISGKWFRVSSYGLNAQAEIDYEAMEALARARKPRLIIAGASTYSLHINFERFSKIAKEVGAFLMVDMAHYSGLIAAGLYPNPVPYADFVTSTTHKGLRGPRGGFILMKSQFEEQINSAVFPGIQGGPLMHVIAGKAIAFKEALDPSFKVYQLQVLKNADAMAGVLAKRGLPIVSGKTQSHMLLVDLRPINLTGLAAEQLLASAQISCNKNRIPSDPLRPVVASGIRIGTPAITTRGFGVPESERVAHLIADLLSEPDTAINAVRQKVRALCAAFPIYGR